MSMTTYGFIGLGLIGGSLAKSIKRIYHEDAHIMAYDIDQKTLYAAQKDCVIDVICTRIDAAFLDCAYIFLCTPVSINQQILLQLKPFLSDTCILTDVGSVKAPIHQMISALQLDAHFIGGHPMAGSEKSGYLHSGDRLIENAYYILTPSDSVPDTSIKAYRTLITALGAIPLLLTYQEHDYVTAAVSHLPHVIAASLVNLVHDVDTKDGIMKLIAAGGFKDITRIASSSPAMWQQISLLNHTNIESLLQDYIASLSKIKDALRSQTKQPLFDLFGDAEQYRSSLPDQSAGPLKKQYLFYVDIPDETGVIATIATILASHQINLKNIGIINNREFEEGALRVEFYEETAMFDAVTVLQHHNYSIIERN
ncbi:MAG: prephenate dehydrogenase [Lachnospiraceae bacterium]